MIKATSNHQEKWMMEKIEQMNEKKLKVEMVMKPEEETKKTTTA